MKAASHILGVAYSVLKISVCVLIKQTTPSFLIPCIEVTFLVEVFDELLIPSQYKLPVIGKLVTTKFNLPEVLLYL